MKISVYIPCYNAAAYLARCIEGILTQTLLPDEILVVDDGSSDDSLQIATGYKQVRVIQHDRNRGLSAARNTAFRAARNEWVGALDADCVPQKGWLRALAICVESRSCDGAGGRLIETVLDSVGDRWRRQHLPQDWGNAPLEHASFLFGNNTLLRKAAVLSVGGYDERLRTNGEDVDMSAKLREAGHMLAYDPAAEVHHLRRDTAASALATYWRYRRDHKVQTTLADVWRNWRYQHFGCARQVLLEDLRHHRAEFLPMDLWMFAYFPWLDLREATKTTVPAHGQTLAVAKLK